MNKGASALQDIFSKFDSSQSGLSQREALKRLKQYGFNTFTQSKNTALQVLTRQFNSSLTLLLIIASLFSFALSDFSDGTVIVVILLINTILGFYQEYKSEQAVEKLTKLISMEILVMRDGKLQLIDEKNLVLGDIVHLKQGDHVPADMYIIDAESLSVNESQLTGESVAVPKVLFGTSEKEKDSSLYTGSFLEQGEAQGLVYAVGNNTELGKIAKLTSMTRKITQYEQSLKSFSSFLMKVTLLTLAGIFVSKLIITHDLSHISTLLLFIIALAVAVVPEALPVIATVTLAKGALRLAKKNVLVKRLSSLEDLGNITLLCTDKTGTLTENKMMLQNIVSTDKDFFQTIAMATLEEWDEKRKKSHSSYDSAFLEYVPETIKEKAQRFKKVQDIPFDPTVRRRRIIIEDTKSKKQYLVVIGASDILIKISSLLHAEHAETVKLDGSKGLRDIGIAYKEIAYGKNFDILKQEHHLHFLGYASFLDPLRKTAKDTLAHAEKLGIAVKVLTGDSLEVATYVGNEVGLLKENDKVYSGDELQGKTDEQLHKIVEECNVFARVTPSQKYLIIKILKENYVVAYQGDGINDAPSLKLADVGIAVNTATDVAKESAEIILLRKDLEVIINGIHYGRGIFVNINKYIKYTMVGNFGNFFTLAVLYLISIDLPLLPIQLLLTSLITDLPHIFIYSDNVNHDQVKKPQKYDIHSLMFISLILGTITTLFELVFFAVIKLQATFFTQTSLFLFLTFIQLIVIFSIRTTDFFWRGKPASLLLASSTGFVFLLSITFLYIPLLAHIFSFIILPTSQLALIVFLTGVYFIVLDVVKVWYYKMSTNNIQPAKLFARNLIN